MRRALEKEKERDLQFNKYHNFEFASAAFQIGIVLCSAAVITGMIALAWAAIGVGLIGVLFDRARASCCRPSRTTFRIGSRRCSPKAGTTDERDLLRRLRLHAAADARDAAEEAARAAGLHQPDTAAHARA